ncbi:MAG: MarR family transcriptional regulator [Thermoplasmata archaeon]
MKLLRDKKTLTKFLLLYHTAMEEPTRLAELAKALEMSEQAVSNYVSEMEEEGLMDTGGKKYKPSPEGVEFVGDVLSRIGAFLERASKEIDFIFKCAAIAEESIAAKDDVGLFMEGGFLYASHEPTASMGLALSSAEAGEPVQVGRLQGIIDMDVGCIYLIAAETDDDPKKSAELLEPLLKESNYNLLAVEDEWALGLTNILQVQVNIKFAPVQSSILAAEKGLNVALILSPRSIDSVVSSINARNGGRPEAYRILYRILST